MRPTRRRGVRSCPRGVPPGRRLSPFRKAGTVADKRGGSAQREAARGVMTNSYDYIVIGAGSAGASAALPPAF